MSTTFTTIRIKWKQFSFLRVASTFRCLKATVEENLILTSGKNSSRNIGKTTGKHTKEWKIFWLWGQSNLPFYPHTCTKCELEYGSFIMWLTITFPKIYGPFYLPAVEAKMVYHLRENVDGFSKAGFTKAINYILLWTCEVNLFLIELHCCHIFSKQMGISANIMIVFIAQICYKICLQFWKTPLANLKTESV